MWAEFHISKLSDRKRFITGELWASNLNEKLGHGLYLRIAGHRLSVFSRLDLYSWSRAYRLYLSFARA